MHIIGCASVLLLVEFKCYVLAHESLATVFKTELDVQLVFPMLFRQPSRWGIKALHEVAPSASALSYMWTLLCAVSVISVNKFVELRTCTYVCVFLFDFCSQCSLVMFGWGLFSLLPSVGWLHKSVAIQFLENTLRQGQNYPTLPYIAFFFCYPTHMNSAL